MNKNRVPRRLWISFNLSQIRTLIGVILLFIAFHANADHTTNGPQTSTPIMGWASWNNYRINISEEIIKSQADAMVSKGLKAVGYSYINIDDGYFGGRDPQTNKVLAHPTRFPNGMKVVADYIHSKGLKAGMYSEAGSNTCAFIYDGDTVYGHGTGLYGHDRLDLTQLLETWGYDFIKIDWCGGKRQGLSEETRYTDIGRIARSIKPDVVYNVCRWQYPGDWVRDKADSWRISGDITENFGSITHIIDLNAPIPR